MATLLQLTNQTTAVTEEITANVDGDMHVFISGKINRGSVSLLVKEADGLFWPYPELTFVDSAMFKLPVVTGDKFKVRFTGCESANLRVRL